VIFASGVDNWVGLGIAVLLAIYLVIVLVRPEKF
jgi:K+-transporting ATPase KdpF subunit